MAFLGAVTLVLLYALRGGGSYDAVVFQENGLVVWLLLAAGVGSGVLPRSRPGRLTAWLLVALGAYAAWTALSLTWTDSFERSSTEVARVLDYLGVIALVSSVLDRRTWRPAAAGLGFGAFLVCGAAVGSRLVPTVFGSDHVDLALHIQRLSVPFGYWNSVGAWGAMTTALGLGWSVHDPVRWRRAIALGLVPLAALTTYLTYSRAGSAGVGLAVITVVGLSRHRLTALVHGVVAAAAVGLTILVVRGSPEVAHGTGTSGALKIFAVLLAAGGTCAAAAALTRTAGTDERRLPIRLGRPLALAGAVILVLIAVALGPRLAGHAWHSFTTVPSTRQTGAETTARLTSLSGTRYPLWRATLNAFAAHPAHGLGAGTIEFWWNEHATNTQFVRNAHSMWLQNLAELGLPGLLLIVAVAAGAVRLSLAARRRARRRASAAAATAIAAAFVVYLAQASVDWMWESTAVTILALAGVAVLGARIGRGRPSLGVAVRAGLVLACLAAGAAQLPGLLSTAAIRRSQDAVRTGQSGVALGWAQAAVSAQPWSATAYQQLGLVHESAARLPEAAADLGRAITREPQNYVHWLVLARIETELRHFGVAVADYERARQLRPRAAIFAGLPR